MSGAPKHGDLAWFENCVPGGYPYRVTVVYRHKRGWFNAAGTDTPLDPAYLADKPLHLFWRGDQPVPAPHPQGGTEALRVLSEAATGGKWSGGRTHVTTDRISPRIAEAVAETHPLGNNDERTANADFIAAAVNYIRALLAAAPAPTEGGDE